MIKILFVDDEMIVRVALKSMVDWEKTEFEVVGAVSDGEAAMAAVKQYHPQIIVTDLQMPKMDGLALAKQLSENGYRGKIIILSSYGEFEYAREAMRYGVSDYLLKASFDGEDLLAALRHAAEALPEESPEPETMEKIDDFNPERIRQLLYEEAPPLPGNYSSRYLAVYLYQREIFSKIHELEQESTKEMLSSLADECVNVHRCTVVPLTENDAVILYSLSGASSDISEIIERDCKRISNSVEIYRNSQAGFVLSDSFCNEEELRHNLLACRNASLLSLYFGYGRLIKQDESKNYTHTLNKDVFATVEQVCDNLTMSNYEEAQRISLEVFHGLALNHISVEEAQRYVRTLFEHITVAYCFYFENDPQRLRDFTMRYEKCSTMEEYKQLVCEIIDEISVSLIKIDETHYRREVMDIITYIKQNIDKKITLAQLSNAVNMAESYISRLFKNETGANLMSYVNMLKMERAMELLKDPNIFVKQAASALGYDDQSYFNRIFNKYFGISPNEFKRSYQSGTVPKHGGRA